MTIHATIEAEQDAASPVEEELTDWAQTLLDGLSAGGGAGVGGEAEVVAARGAGGGGSFRAGGALEAWPGGGGGVGVLVPPGGRLRGLAGRAGRDAVGPRRPLPQARLGPAALGRRARR